MLGTGDRIGDWIIDTVLGFGRPARYRVRAVDDPERVASVLVTDADGPVADRLERTAQVLQEVQHSVLPAYIDHGTDEVENLSWLATDDFEGDRLEDWLREGPLDWRDAAAVMWKIATAVRALHDCGFVHRDITPANIILGPNWTVQLTGLGLCRTVEEATGPDLPNGNLTYAAPEVISGHNEVPHRADLYALGIVFFEAVTARAAFPAALQGEKPDEALRLLSWKTRAQPLDPGESVPNWLAGLIRKATVPSPEDRIPDVDAFIGWLDAAETQWKRSQGRPLASSPPSITMSPLTPLVATPTFQPEVAQAPQQVVVSRPPMVLLYMGAAAAGVVAAFGFSAVAIAFVDTLG